jgi:hypothetical protein
MKNLSFFSCRSARRWEDNVEENGSRSLFDRAIGVLCGTAADRLAHCLQEQNAEFPDSASNYIIGRVHRMHTSSDGRGTILTTDALAYLMRSRNLAVRP